MMKLFPASAFAVVALFSACVPAAEIFVSPAGIDSNSGAANRPIYSLAAAQQKARAINGREPVTITLYVGTYYLAAPLVLMPEDSGTKENPVIWQAAPGAKVVISGGRRLDLQWTAYKDGILQARVPDDADFDQLFVNGERQIMARYPNFDPSVLVFNGHAADCVHPQRALKWADPAGGFLHAMHPGQWGGFSYLITGKDPKAGVTMEGGWQGNRRAGGHKELRFVENIFEELDAPGEWFLNRKTHTLYFYPPAGLDLAKATVEAAGNRHLVEFRGTEQSPVRWVSFRGMTFTHTARTFMETKEPLLRSDWTIYRGGAVVCEGTEDCTLSESFFDQVGGNGVFASNYNRRLAVKSCRFDRGGAGAVMFVGDPKAVRSPLFEYGQRQPIEQIDRTPGPLTNNYPADCRVDDCLITQVGRFEKQSTGVGIDMAARITISHCSIYDMPRAGINIGDGCWGGHIVEFCDVFDTVKETGDHGSFNSWGRDRYWLPNIKAVDKLVAANPGLPLLDNVEPTTLRNSRWRCDHGWDIDLDDGSSNYRIYNNLCLHGGLKNREGFGRVVENNIVAFNSFHPHVWFADSGDTFAKNIVFTAYHPIGMPAKWGKQVDFNLLHTLGVAGTQPATALQKSSGQDEHSLQADALFVDSLHGDFTVKEGSPALGLGFKNFPMDQFGVTSPALKKIARVPSFEAGKEEGSKRDRRVQEWLGAKVRNIVGQGERSAHGLPGEVGVLILEVPDQSAASRAGIKANDVVLGFGGKDVTTAGDLIKLTRSAPKESEVELVVWRDQKSLAIKVRIQP